MRLRLTQHHRAGLEVEVEHTLLRLDELRPDMGRKYLATIVATLWPKHHADDPERLAMQWAAEREAK